MSGVRPSLPAQSAHQGNVVTKMILLALLFLQTVSLCQGSLSWGPHQPHQLVKRSPDADPAGGSNGVVTFSVTASLDTLRQKLLWSLHNNRNVRSGQEKEDNIHSLQVGRTTLEKAGK